MHKIWQGDEKLWKTFWGGIFFPLVLFFVMGFVSALFHLSPQTHVLFRATLFYVLQLAYIVVWAVCVWKCRENSSSSAWKWLALFAALIVVLGGIAAVMAKLNPPSISAYNPSCVKTLEDFAQQNHIDPHQYMMTNLSYLRKCTKEFYRNTCLKTMQDFATKNGLNADDYIKQNQSYLGQCSQSLEDQAASTRQ